MARVVMPDELGKADEMLKEQIQQLEIYPQDNDATLSVSMQLIWHL